MGNCFTMKEGPMYCLLDDMAILPLVKKKLEAVRILFHSLAFPQLLTSPLPSLLDEDSNLPVRKHRRV